MDLLLCAFVTSEMSIMYVIFIVSQVNFELEIYIYNSDG